MRNPTIKDVRIRRGILETVDPKNILMRSTNETDMFGSELFQDDIVEYDCIEQPIISKDAGLIMECNGELNKDKSKAIKKIGNIHQSRINKGMI